MDLMKTSDDSFTPSLVLAVILLLASVLVITQLKDVPAGFSGLKQEELQDLIHGREPVLSRNSCNPK